jgi:hypothetical protein
MKLSKDVIETFIRAVLKIGGGFLVAKGIGHEGQVDEVVTALGGVAAIAGFIMGLFSAKTDAEVKAGTTTIVK